MQIQVLFEGIESSPWFDEFIARRAARLERFAPPSSIISVSFRVEDGLYVTSLSIRDHHNYFFTANAETLYESFSIAMERAIRELTKEKQRLKQKINRKYVA